ncbi:hypothetical protein QYM36_017579 [Artemia franciscana]|uniref:Endonuclease/exonuclease/phosphatase domain-containing protein n=1 Tax=Artemia franciscana TaxID=6661 RepID=A0AA88H667_ARTSF|nr:hypothetical protein QYM36_017579 [Artemia franciscana]
MDSYGLDILALSEVCWTGAGRRNLDMGYTILHSGLEKNKEAGVAIMLSKPASKALTKWTPIIERIITAQFAGNNAKLTLVASYAPTNDADDVTKDSFYNTLQAVAKDIPSHDLICFAGDFNAKVGNETIIHFYEQFRLLQTRLLEKCGLSCKCIALGMSKDYEGIHNWYQ